MSPPTITLRNDNERIDRVTVSKNLLFVNKKKQKNFVELVLGSYRPLGC